MRGKVGSSPENFGAERTAEAGEAAAEAEGERKHPIDVDAEPARHAAVVDRGAQPAAEAGLGEDELQRDRQQSAQHDDQQPVAADADAGDLELALQVARNLHEHLARAHDIVGRRDRHEDEADGEQHLVEVRLSIDMRIERALEQEADRRARKKRHRQRQEEGNTQAVDQKDGDIGAGHGKRAVREIDEIHQAERHREAGREHEQQHAVGNSVEKNCEHISAAKSARSRKFVPDCAIVYQPIPAGDLTFDKACARRCVSFATGARGLPTVGAPRADRMNVQQSRLISNNSGDRVLKSVCRSCHGGCGVLLHVRDGVLEKVEGDRESPLSHGRLCPIGTVTTDLVYHPDRLKYPLRRKGKRRSGEWKRISWDDALDEISQRLLAIREQYGPEAIALGTGTGRHHIRWVSRFGHALGTPNWCEPGFAQCFHPRVNTSILTFGDFPVSDYTGDVAPACILFWGHNPVLSGPDGETRFNVWEALAHNPRTIVVDPRRTALAEKADFWLQIRPGADDALALAMLNVVIGEKLYDEPFVTQWTHGFAELAEHVKRFTPDWAEPITWIAADQIRAAARLFANAKPALLDWGCAIEHTPKCIQTIRAVSMLPALTGNIDVPGGWVFGMHGLGRFPSLIENLTPEANAKRLGADQFKLLGGEGADLPAAHIPTLLKAMREGKPYPVKAFLVFGNNTLTTYANTSQVYSR